MILHTASEGISLAKKLENDSAAFYESLAKQFANNSETFLNFAKENKKNIANIERTYYGVITDAIEGCFCYDLDSDKYDIDTSLTANISLSEAVKKALELEDKIIKFYNDAAMQSMTLMADVPRVFALMAKKRETRKQTLQSLTKKF